jgi:hypothetical protein
MREFIKALPENRPISMSSPYHFRVKPSPGKRGSLTLVKRKTSKTIIGTQRKR